MKTTHTYRSSPQSDTGITEAMFTLYETVKQSATESVLDRASVHTGNAAFEAVSAPE